MDVSRPLPWWVVILEQAAEWSMSPWQITGDDAQVLWHYRWLAYRSEQAKAMRDKQQHHG